VLRRSEFSDAAFRTTSRITSGVAILSVASAHSWSGRFSAQLME
jgi:hypothetical protein